MHVTLAGKGPIEAELRKRATDLGLDVDFGFFEQDELRDLMCASDVYVHCADVEVEGMSCMEAFACGCVPVISDASLSSTKAYALTGHNVFSHANAVDLAAKLDWLYENRSDLAALSRQYIEYAQGLGVHGCAEKVLAMMEEARNRVARDQAGFSVPAGPHAVAARLRVRISRGVHHRLGRERKDGNNGRA